MVRQGFERLAAHLRALKGIFLLTINDTPETRRVFAGFAIQSTKATYGVSGGATAAREIIVSGR